MLMLNQVKVHYQLK